jgi:putative tricarboxylic transport membrane protein
MPHVKNLNDVLVGITLVAIATFALILAWPLNPGTMATMGPGFFPRLLAFIEIALGLAIILQGFAEEGEVFERWFPRQMFFVLASILFFGLAIFQLGVIIAVSGTVLIACLAHRGTRFHEAALLAVGMAVFVVLVFPIALGLPMQIVPMALVH